MPKSLRLLIDRARYADSLDVKLTLYILMNAVCAALLLALVVFASTCPAHAQNSYKLRIVVSGTDRFFHSPTLSCFDVGTRTIQRLCGMAAGGGCTGYNSSAPVFPESCSSRLVAVSDTMVVGGFFTGSSGLVSASNTTVTLWAKDIEPAVTTKVIVDSGSITTTPSGVVHSIIDSGDVTVSGGGGGTLLGGAAAAAGTFSGVAATTSAAYEYPIHDILILVAALVVFIFAFMVVRPFG